MTLIEICDPLFYYYCRLNRAARHAGVNLTMESVRSDFKNLFRKIRSQASDSPEYTRLLDTSEGGGRIELVLTYFVDSMIYKSDLPFRDEWSPMSYEEHGDNAFEDNFWTEFEDALRDNNEMASERLSIFYVCLGLGFVGNPAHVGRDDTPEAMRTAIQDIASRLGDRIDREPHHTRLVSDRDLNVDTRVLYLPPSHSLAPFIISVVCLAFVLFIGNIVLYISKTNALTKSLNTISQLSDSQLGVPSNSNSEAIKKPQFPADKPTLPTDVGNTLSQETHNSVSTPEINNP